MVNPHVTSHGINIGHIEQLFFEGAARDSSSFKRFFEELAIPTLETLGDVTDDVSKEKGFVRFYSQHGYGALIQKYYVSGSWQEQIPIFEAASEFRELYYEVLDRFSTRMGLDYPSSLTIGHAAGVLRLPLNSNRLRAEGIQGTLADVSNPFAALEHTRHWRIWDNSSPNTEDGTKESHNVIMVDMDALDYNPSTGARSESLEKVLSKHGFANWHETYGGLVPFSGSRWDYHMQKRISLFDEQEVKLIAQEAGNAMIADGFKGVLRITPFLSSKGVYVSPVMPYFTVDASGKEAVLFTTEPLVRTKSL